MKRILLCHLLLFSLMLTLPYTVSAEQRPDMIVEKMAIKHLRGLANTAFGIVEFPKQIVLTGQDMGAIGYIFVGPLKGIGMTVYRTFIGLTEATFFLVPQPGYYDPMINPAYVWQGWEPRQDLAPPLQEEEK